MGWDDSAPTSQELTSVGWDAHPPTDSELGKSGSVSDAYKSGGVKGAFNQVVNNAKAIGNYNPSNEDLIQSAKHPFTGMEDPVYTYGMGLASETSALKGIGSLLKSGKAKITGLFSSEQGLHPIIEAAEGGAPSVAKQIYDPFTKTLRTVGGEAGSAVAQEAAPVAQATMKEVFDPFTKTTKMIPVAAEAVAPVAENALKVHPAVKEAGKEVVEAGKSFVEKLGHHAHLASPSVAGAYIGSKVAEEAGLPEWMGAAAGGAGGPLAVKAFMKFGKTLIPIMESPAAQAGTRAALATKGYSEGGTVTPNPPPPPPPTYIDPDRAKEVQDSMRKAFHFANGGMIPGAPQVPMDSPQNDNTIIKATPGEVVLPLSVTRSPNAPQRAKEFMQTELSKNGNPQAPQTGSDKWASDGFQTLKSHVSDDDRKFLDDNKAALMLDPKSQNLIIAASSFKPGSKPLDDIIKHLKNRIGGK